jgi:hypothetical protein
MPRVTVTAYELENELLPSVCATCGEPATDHVAPVVCEVDGWQGGVQVFGVLGGLFFFPPLLFFTLRFARRIAVRVPVCTTHRDSYLRSERAEKRYLMPVWTAAAVLVDAWIVAEVCYGGPGMSCCGSIAVLLGILTAGTLLSRGRVRVTKQPKKDIVYLDKVHPAFVAALAQDRARDRISNPDRRVGHGDVRDDYDDEVK